MCLEFGLQSKHILLKYYIFVLIFFYCETVEVITSLCQRLSMCLNANLRFYYKKKKESAISFLSGKQKSAKAEKQSSNTWLGITRIKIKSKSSELMSM